MKKLIKKLSTFVKKQKENTKLNSMMNISIECFFNKISMDNMFGDYFLSYVSDLITNNFNVSLVFVNEYSIEIKGTEASGIYRYFKNNEIKDCTKRIYKKDVEYDTVKSELTLENFPCIFISKDSPKSMAFTALHELGHHIIELNGLDQSEELADAYIRVIMEEMLDPVFLYVYNIGVNVYSKIEKPINMSWKQAYKKIYKPFLLVHPELNLKTI